VAEGNPRFNDSVRGYRRDANQWWQVCELPFDQYRVSAEMRR
jgi:hypothetical protein